VGETFAFDVKSNAAVGGTEGDNKVEYFWAADKNNGYASNYYSGHLTLSEEELGVGIARRYTSNVTVYVFNDFMNFKGLKQPTDVKIYSITGSLVKSVEKVSGQINISDLADGVYLVKLAGEPAGFKVVK
jgi:hypothetical protein